MFGWTEFTDAGGLLASYGPSVLGYASAGGEFVDKILKGARPADVAVEQASGSILVLDHNGGGARIGLTDPGQ